MSGDDKTQHASRISVLRHLHGAGVRVMCPLSRTDGSLYLNQEGIFWVVYQKIRTKSALDGRSGNFIP